MCGEGFRKFKGDDDSDDSDYLDELNEKDELGVFSNGIYQENSTRLDKLGPKGFYYEWDKKSDELFYESEKNFVTKGIKDLQEEAKKEHKKYIEENKAAIAEMKYKLSKLEFES